MEEQAIAVAKYDYTAEGQGELSIRKNEKLTVIDDTQLWWKVQNEKSVSGYVPSNYLARKDSVKGKKNIVKTIKEKLNTKKTNEVESPQADLQSPKLKGGGKVLMVGTAKFKYIPQRDDEIELSKGDTVMILEMEHDGWCRGESNGKVGWLPFNYLQKSEPQGEQASPSEYADPNDVMDKQIICKVRTLYPFNSQSSEELSFEKDSILEIVDKPKDDPDWWQARKSSGEIGLVPRNYVDEIVSPVLTPGPAKPKQGSNFPALSSSPAKAPPRDLDVNGKFNDRPWYHGSLKRQECENVLRTHGEDGQYLVRNSESKPGDFSLSMKAPDRMKHFKITHTEDQYVIGQRSFDSMDSLISHYEKAPIYTTEAGQKMYLTQPMSKSLTRNGYS